jgi:hypothetical protein
VAKAACADGEVRAVDDEATKVDLECRKLRLEIDQLGGWCRRWARIQGVAATLGPLLTGMVAVLGLIWGKTLLDLRDQELKTQKQLQDLQGADIEALQRRWRGASSEIFDEPSDVTPTELSTPTAEPLVAAVDDEEEEIFLLQPLGPRHFAVYRAVTHKEPVDDLEAVCLDSRTQYYYAVASHREVDDDLVSRVLRFRVSPDDVSSNEGFAIPALELRAYDLRAGLRTALGAGEAPLADVSGEGEKTLINSKPWGEKRGRDQPYALEIEGAVCIAGKLVIGLRWPLDPQDRAILLEYDLAPDAPQLDKQPPKPVLLELGGLAKGRGKDELLVASNPPQHDAFGTSRVDVFDTSTRPYKRVKAHDAGRPHHRLEGLAIVDREVWLVYEGEKGIDPEIEHMALDDFERLPLPRQPTPS